MAYIRTRQQIAREEGNNSSDGLAILFGSDAGDMTDFVKYNVSIHSVITDRIDQLRPNQQLTLKVSDSMILNDANQAQIWIFGDMLGA